MNIGGESANVYADAKTEYTRQVCQILTPAIQLYFLDLLKAAKERDQDPRRLLWNFQTMLQEIPDWNQDKVLRETERIQRDSNCDYLEELITAVFIAHTKVLSAIRISTKQRKLQLTIPKIDHFLHRTLRETGRLLWGNAFLFAEQGSGIERQKNMRQVESLIQEGIQQSIRSLLPVKNILREYLNDDDSDEEQAGDLDHDEEKKMEEKAIVEEKPVEEEKKVVEAPTPAPAPPKPTEESEDLKVTTPISHVKSVVTITKEDAPAASVTEPIVQIPEALPLPLPQAEQEQEPPMLVVQTEPSVSFTNMDTIFDSEHLDGNEIADSPMESAYEEGEVDHIETLNLPPEPLDDFEDLEPKEDGIEFETLDA